MHICISPYFTAVYAIIVYIQPLLYNLSVDLPYTGIYRYRRDFMLNIHTNNPLCMKQYNQIPITVFATVFGINVGGSSRQNCHPHSQTR